ncbi:MAG TPA: cytochrome b N-terminal domain-containing protein [Candidatus Saccharimonadales bacterium]|nr:cytochrome b N-terminal domain-containing protein [Candidatus Saccharimonadales bacterium]
MSFSKLPLVNALRQTMIQDVPAYANKFFYSLGFLSMICFVVLLVTGVVMAVYGPDWWLISGMGKYFRSVHLWATQAFVLFIILHLMVVFFSSGFKKPRRLTWVLGSLMFFFVLSEAEFGYVLRGDFSSQWRSLQGADFYNGTGLGQWINNINYQQIYGIHLVVIPLVIIGLLFCHYLLVRFLGIAKPYKAGVNVPTVKANHTILFARGAVLVVLLLLLAIVFPSPFLKPDTVKSVAEADKKLVGQTLVKEFDRSSDTATYLDNIDPYTYDTREIYVQRPYAQLVALQGTPNLLQKYAAESEKVQATQLKQATDYFDKVYPGKADAKNPLEPAITSLVNMAAAGLYEPTLNSASPSGDKSTYALRFLADTGVMDDRAQALGITTDQYGMLREEQGHLPPGAWWLAPIGVLNHTVLSNDDNGDRDGAIILGTFFLLLIAFPYIPGLNRLPEVFRLYKVIWRV